MPARLVLLATSPRLAPGLLSWEAWSVLRAADAVLLADPDHPLMPALTSAGIDVRVTAYDSVDVLADLLLALPGESVWVASPDGDPGLAEVVAARLEAEATAPAVAVDVVLGSWDLPGARLVDLVAVMDRLRSPGGCPWDAQQTHESLVEYLVEETYETVEAIETADDPALREELGDLLLQVVFHARIAQEHEQPWGIDEVADGIVAKLVSRHPHVFADHDARTPEEVEANWKRLKAAEKGRESVTDGIPQALPALVLAAKLLRRAADVKVAAAPDVADDLARDAIMTLLDAVDYPDIYGDVEDDLEDDLDGDLEVDHDGDLDGRSSGPLPVDVTSAYGALLLAVAARAHGDGVDPEQALRAAVRDYRARVRAAEQASD